MGCSLVVMVWSLGKFRPFLPSDVGCTYASLIRCGCEGEQTKGKMSRFMFLTAEWFWEGENVNPVDRGVGGAAWRQPESTCLPAGRAYTRVKHLSMRPPTMDPSVLIIKTISPPTYSKAMI